MGKMIKKSLLLPLAVVFILAACFPLSRASQANPQAGTAWLDQFTTKDPRWDWAYHSGTGYRILGTLPDGTSVAEIGITTDSTTSVYSDNSLHETSPSHPDGVAEMRLKTSDDNGLTIPGAGTRGWGFFDGDTSLGNAAWFWSAPIESDPVLAGFKAQVIRNGLVVFNQDLYTGTLKIDMTRWHTYRVDLKLDGVSFYVDNTLVASTNSRPDTSKTLQRVELWIDNIAVKLSQPGPGYTIHYLAVPQDEKMWIDWVSYHDQQATPAGTPPGSGRFFLDLPILFK
ncbi:MAG TPA: hypothetical protein VF498_03060 [Anaerolineales bacterium]